MSRCRFVLFCLFTMVITGCGSDPRAASKENFTRAIDAKLANSSRLCLEDPNPILTNDVVLPYRMLARAVAADAVLPQGVVVFEPTQHRQLAALVSVRLASRQTVTVTARRQYYAPSSEGFQLIRTGTILVFDPKAWIWDGGLP